MVVVPLQKSSSQKSSSEYNVEPTAQRDDSMNWVGLAAGGTLIAGGLMLLTGHRRAGLVTAASGATLALLDQKDAVHSWWNLLPLYIENVQRLLSQVEDTVQDVGVQREKLRKILAR
jgi:hypothetical protein